MSDSRLISVQEENTALRLRMRQQEGVLSRVHLRSEREREASVLPVLRERVHDLERTNARTAAELAETQHLLRAFQQETYALRTLIKFAEHPDKTVAARAEGERLAALDEVKRLGDQLAALHDDHAACQRRCEEALAAAAQYRHRLATDEGGVLARSGSPAATDEDEPVERPRNTRRSHASLSGDSLAADDMTSSEAEEEEELAVEEDVDAVHGRWHRDARAEPANRKMFSSRPPLDASMPDRDVDRASHDTLTVNEVSDVEAGDERVRRAMAVLRGENVLLTRRISSVVSQNKQFIETIANLELRCAELANRAGGSP